jgi:hypothetical protein
MEYDLSLSVSLFFFFSPVRVLALVLKLFVGFKRRRRKK